MGSYAYLWPLAHSIRILISCVCTVWSQSLIMKSTLWYLSLFLVTVFHGETLSVTKTGKSSVLIKDQQWKKAKVDFVDNSNEELSDEHLVCGLQWEGTASPWEDLVGEGV